MARASDDANNMHQLSWDTKGKEPNISKYSYWKNGLPNGRKYTLSLCVEFLSKYKTVKKYYNE